MLTSSFAAVGYGHGPRETPYTEADWTDPGGRDVAPYIKSKTLAERAAWDFVEREGQGLELSVINPVGFFGPVLGPDFSSSIGIVKALMDGAMPATPHIYFGVVDVRDVVALHILAMTSPQAKGERFIAVAGPAISMHEAAKTLRARFGAAARKTPRFQCPDSLFRIAAVFVPHLRATLPQLGIIRNSSNEKAKRVLGWSPRPAVEAIAASGESLIRLGLLTRHRKPKP